MADIFDEIQEDLRAERLQRLMVRYGGVLLAIVVAIVGATGLWKGWDWWQGRQDAAIASAYVRAMEMAEAEHDDSSSTQKGFTAFTNIANSSAPGYRVLGRLNEAALKANGGKFAEALAVWDQISGNPAVSSTMRNLSTLLWAQHQVNKGDPSVVAARLNALVGSGDLWSSLAEEQLAILNLHQPHEQAKSSLMTIQANPAAPADVRTRANVLLSELDD